MRRIRLAGNTWPTSEGCALRPENMRHRSRASRICGSHCSQIMVTNHILGTFILQIPRHWLLRYCFPRYWLLQYCFPRYWLLRYWLFAGTGFYGSRKTRNNAHGRQVVSGLLYMHKELGLAHGALNCSTILLDLNGRVKIGKF